MRGSAWLARVGVLGLIVVGAATSQGAPPGAAPAPAGAPASPTTGTGPATRTEGRPPTDAPYRDRRRPVAERVRDLLSRMTTDEKLAQLQALWVGKKTFLRDDDSFDPSKARVALALGIGHIAQVSHPPDFKKPGFDARTMATLANDIQRFLLERTRLGIPATVHEEALHGLRARGATMFPQALALAATFDEALIEEVFAAAARETRARGGHHVLAPVVDVARDPRWGRTEETYGEDPFLVARLGVAAVRGFQGRGHDPARDTALPSDRVLATAKHFAGHGTPEGGRNTAPGNVSLRTLREVVLPPFEALVREAGIESVMASYNEVDGVPSHGNRWLLRDVLRGEWGFRGTVVADYFAIDELASKHRVVADKAAAARLALTTGVDLELPDPDTFPLLARDLAEGRLAPALVDEAVARILRQKFLLGLFDGAALVDVEAAARADHADRHRALALRAAHEAIVLLENRNATLPLDRGRLRRVAVVGPNAEVCHLGGYSEAPATSVGILDGLRRKLGPKVAVDFERGCRITMDERQPESWTSDEVKRPEGKDDAADVAGIRRAAALARRADATVVVLGQNEQVSREAWSEKHLGDRDDLDLLGRQQELFDAVLKAAAGKPVIVVLVHGAPLSIGDIAARAPAIVDAVYLGQETGTAVADVLVGDVSPAGRLPMTVPRSVGQLPAYYGHKPSATRSYLFAGGQGPLWSFGHGLSYTTFRYGPPRLGAARIKAHESTTLSVDVTNTGSRTSDEVVQLYVRDQVSSVTRPVRELVGFRRIHLGPGQTQTVTFPVGPEALRLWGADGKRVVEPGTFSLFVGGQPDALTEVKLDVVGG